MVGCFRRAFIMHATSTTYTSIWCCICLTFICSRLAIPIPVAKGSQHHLVPLSGAKRWDSRPLCMLDLLLPAVCCACSTHLVLSPCAEASSGLARQCLHVSLISDDWRLQLREMPQHCGYLARTKSCSTCGEATPQANTDKTSKQDKANERQLPVPAAIKDKLYLPKNGERFQVQG